MTTSRVPIEIVVQPWFKDHSFNGRIVLPAVETMNLLAAEVAGGYPDMEVRVMEQARFARFLEIPPHCTKVDALIECRNENGSICAKLLRRTAFKTMTRLREHGEIRFSPVPLPDRLNPAATVRKPEESAIKVPAERIYREMVPFGPAYQTLTAFCCSVKRGPGEHSRRRCCRKQIFPNVSARPSRWMELCTPPVFTVSNMLISFLFRLALPDGLSINQPGLVKPMGLPSYWYPGQPRNWYLIW